ncbi:TonB-dependent receptor [Aquirufa antheringensis]|uniref:TonB-dependent receptor n=1 Tax=Aquirufa antheringensis TaxID=2516559 RepID=A0A4V2IVL3_9BACT|nr:TonB-dependent receptor [Aquirufa antheringensis]TBH72145.1 TonB-dependent receptor [Aquirufa antheringensis]
MKYLYLLLVLYSFSSFSQTNCHCTLKGIVASKENKEKVPGAYVYLKGTTKSTTSDAKGAFILKDLCPGKYTLVCQMASFDLIETEIYLEDEKEEDFLLSTHDEHLQEVFVQGRKQEITSQMKSALSAEERSQKEGLSLGEMLKGLTGVQSLQTGSSVSKPVIHGLHSSRVIILNQGVRQEGQNWGSEHAPEIDPFVSKNIQVIKGPGGLRYGGDAIGGIVMLEPNALPDSSAIHGSVQSIYFSNGRQGVISGLLEGGIPRQKGWGWRIQGTLKDGGNVRTADYYLSNTGVKEENVSMAIGYKSAGFGADFFVSRFHTVIGIYEGSHIGNISDLERSITLSRPLAAFTPTEFIRRIDRPNQDVWHDLAKVKAFYHLPNQATLRATVAAQSDERWELDVLRAGKNINTLRFNLNTHSGELVYDETNTNKRWKGQAGFTFLDQGNITSGNKVQNPVLTTSLLPNYSLQNLGVFAIERRVTEKWELEAGLRYDIKEIETHRPKANFSQSILRSKHHFAGVSGSLGLTYHWNPLTESLFTISRAFRAPGANELFSNGVHHGAGAYEIGDPTLEGETGTNFSFSTNYKPERWDIEVGLYSNHIRNFIYLRPSVINLNAVYATTVRGVFPIFSYQQIDARFQGIDFQATYSLSPRLTVQQKTSIVRAFDTLNEQYLVNIPADRFEYLLRYAFKSNKAYVSGGITQVSKQTRVEGGSDYAVPPAGYFLVQVNGGMTYKKLEVNLSVSNALNAAYRDYLNRFRYYADDQGRNISLKVSYSI